MHRRLMKNVARGVLILAIAEGPGAAVAATENDQIIATVDGLPIRSSEVQERKRRVESVYTQRTGKAVPQGYDSFFARSALDELVHDRLIQLDAKARGVVISDAAAESLLKADDDFTKGGRFDAAAYERYKRENPVGWKDALGQAKEALAAQRHGEAVQRELEPSAQELDRLWRTRYGRVRGQAVWLPDIATGGRAEPTDEEVAAAYARNPAAYERPAELEYTILSVLTPEPDAEARRSRMERVLAEARLGLPFDSLSRRHGGYLSQHKWREGQDAAGFESHPELLRQAVASPAGTVLTEAVSSNEGFYLVRVDRSRARGPAPLSAVAGDVRARLAEDRLRAEREAEAKKVYDADPKKWVVPARQVRWAVVDSARVTPRPPSDGELEEWYRSHSAAFARVDPAGGGLLVPKLEDVRAQAAAMWSNAQRASEARRLADEVATSWGGGKSAKKSPAVTLGGPAWFVDDGAPPAGLAPELADSARSWRTAGRAIVTAQPRGYTVLHLMKIDPASKATFEMAEPRIRRTLAAQHAAKDSADAHAFYTAHRERYSSGRGYSIVWVPVTFPDPSIVNVPGDAIERFYRDRKSELGTPEQVRVRHILVRPSAGSWAQAETRARALLTRVQAGEEFGALAARESDDPLTSGRGGDMGWLKRCFAPGPFEDAAFALTPANPLSGVVRTEFGFHLIRLEDRRAGSTPSFQDSRIEIGRRLAAEYADTLARRSATNLRETTADARDLFDRGVKQRYAPHRETWYEGTPATGALADEDLRRAVLASQPGSVLPMTPRYGMNQYLVIGVDSVFAPSILPVDQVRERALADARASGSGASRADRVERDLASGKSWEDAIEGAGNTSDLFVLRASETGPLSVPGIDTLLFGQGPGALAAGQTRRVAAPGGTWFVHVLERIPPEPAAEANRSRVRDVVLNRRLYDYDEALRARHRVVVLDESLSERLPPPPAMP